MDIKSYKCSVCNYEFKSPNELKDHSDKMHSYLITSVSPGYTLTKITKEPIKREKSPQMLKSFYK